MEFMSVFALIQPLVILSGYVVFQFFTKESSPDTKSDLKLAEKITMLEERLSLIEKQTVSSKFVGELAETITRCEDEIANIVETIKELASDNIANADDQSMDLSSSIQKGDDNVGVFLVGLAAIQLVTSVLLIVLWCFVSRKRGDPLLNEVIKEGYVVAKNNNDIHSVDQKVSEEDDKQNFVELETDMFSR